MSKNNSYISIFLLILLLLKIKIINGQAPDDKFYFGETNFTISYLTKNFKVPILKDNSTDCPFFSSGPREIYRKDYIDGISLSSNISRVITICDVSFACHEDRCIYYKSPYTTFIIKNNTQHSLQFSKEGNENEKLIIHSCLKKDEYCNANNNDVKCKSNSDCFSNICDKGRCIINAEKPLKLCRITYDTEEDFSIGCGLDINEPCKESNTCDTQYCSSYTRICFNNKITYRFSPVSQYFFIFLGFVMLILLSLVLYLYYIRDKLVSHNLRHHNNDQTMANNSRNGNSSSSTDSDSDSDVIFNNIYYHNNRSNI